MLRGVIFFMLAGITALAQAGLLETGYRAVYEVSVDDIYVGTAVREVRVQGDKLVFSSRAKPGGIAALFFSDVVRENSEMRREGKRILAEVYTYSQSGGKESKSEAVYFDHKGKQVIFSHGDGVERPFRDAAYDVLNFQIAMMLKLQQGQQAFTLQVADYRDLYTYQLRVVGKEKITVPYGELETVKVDSYNPRDKKHFVFWCAPSLDYLPVKVEYTKRPGDRVKRLELKSLDKGRGTSDE
jgi:hypothetical protein